MTDDPFEQAAEAIRTAIGSDETQLRSKLGNEGYEAFKANLDRSIQIQLTAMQANADIAVAQAKHAAAKARFWTVVTAGVVWAVMLGVVWAMARTIWYWVR